MSIARKERVTLPYLSHPAWWATLDNGQQIFAVHKPGEVAHIHTLVRTGSVNETDENTGVSHFLEHLMFKGTQRYPAGAFDRTLEGLGARVNAATSKDWTQYYVTLPKGQDGASYRTGLDLHADMLLHAELPAEEIGPPFDPDKPTTAEKRERMVVIEEIKMGRDNPWRQAITRLSELVYPTHPYRREVIGAAPVIAGIPRDAIVDYYRTWYQPANMVTIVTGEMEADEVISDVEQHFAFADTRPISHPAFPPEAPPQSPRIERLTLPLNVAYVVLAFLGPHSTDIKAGIAIDVLSLILGEGLSSRIHQRLVDQLPNTPFFEAGASHWSNRDSSLALGFGIVRPDSAEEAFELLRKEIARLHTEPPTPREVEKALTRLETSFAAQAETATGLSDALADSMARLNNPAYYTDYLATLKSLTRDDLANYATQYLADDHICAVIVAPGGGE